MANETTITSNRALKRALGHVGKRRGHLTIVSSLGVMKFRKGSRNCYFLVRCDCGTELQMQLGNFDRRETEHCGCKSPVREMYPLGGHRHPLFKTWSGMIDRCHNSNSPLYPYYGSRGIEVCERWLRGNSTVSAFECFCTDMGDKPSSELSIERRDVNGNYEPSNCEWANPEVQSNNKTNNVHIDFDGRRMTVSQWSRETGISRETLRTRMKMGWSSHDVLTRPVRLHP